MKTLKKFTELYGQRSLTRTKASIKTLNCPTDQETKQESEQQEQTTAGEKERQQLQDNNVYTVINKNSILYKTKIVDTKQIYKKKYNKDSSLDKYKARKIGPGFTQEYKVNYDKTYAQMM